MEKLEDTLLQLKFDRYSDDFSYGQQEAIKFCIRKHQEGWIVDDFKKELCKTSKLNRNDEYIQGIIDVFKYNIKIMEELENEQTSNASSN